MRFAFGAGGTGGHIVPAIALADELRRRGHKGIFLGNADSMEERLATAANYPFFPIRVQKLYRSLSPTNLLFPYHLVNSVFQSRRILEDQNIDAVITTGGFVAGPVALAGNLLKLPGFLHESNSYPGLTTRHLARYLTRLYISFEESAKHLHNVSIRRFGIPIQNKPPDPDFRLEDIGLRSGENTLLITGGSQGSLAINEVVSASIDTLLEDFGQIIWQTGRRSYEQFSTLHQDREGLYIFDFSMQMNDFMHHSDLALTRAGALTIAELESSQTPAILIPLPTAAGNHQHHNAIAQVNKGVAKLLQQDQLNPMSLMNWIKSADITRMKKHLAALPENQACQMIISDILACIKER